ncbi:hypothetical protein [Paenibacillus qinlingensis]|uniref:Uncharacterized protein n=1 Tax=Paenibacillus qinlingensis TaxID=1837343 RepID=A0ABU1P361_9BACL|nr:hypothetical protein [Paenibacillus qinlingensis]MDR6554184.1 hypothetical protein [Paenibacillus qinlingensis]
MTSMKGKALPYKDLHLGGRPFLWYAKNRMNEDMKQQPEEVHRWEKK